MVCHGLTRLGCTCQYWHVLGYEEIVLDRRFTFQGKGISRNVQDNIGYALYVAQLGRMSSNAKSLQGLGAGVMEIAANDASGTYRAVYTVSIGESIYVLRAFQKKSKSGIATPMAEIDVVRQRLKQLRIEVKNAEEKKS